MIIGAQNFSSKGKNCGGNFFFQLFISRIWPFGFCLKLHVVLMKVKITKYFKGLKRFYKGCRICVTFNL